MRMLIATGIYPPSIGGPATYSKLLFDELPKRGIEVKILSFDEVRKFPKILRHIIYLFKVLFRSRDCDLIYLQDPASVGLPGLIASKIVRKKIFLKIVGDYAWEQGVQRFGVTDSLDVFCRKGRGYGLGVWLLKFIQRNVAKFSDTIIVPSEYLKRVVVAWGVNEEKIMVIHNSFDANLETVNRNSSHHKIELSKKVILSAGRLVPWKGFETLIVLMPEILEKVPDASLVIAGDGPDYERLLNLIKEKGLEDHINLTGQLSHDVLLSYIRASTVFVLNTSYEGLSHQLLEVMACGVPVITTNVGGNPEVITNGKDGVLVSYNNKDELLSHIVRLLTHSSNREKLIKAGFDRVLDFTTPKMLSKLVSVLQNS